MPQRMNRYKVECDKVQGEGSWVDLTRLTWGEVQAIMAKTTDTDQTLKDHVKDWNWVYDQVDAEGNPLPISLPSKDEAVLGSLTYDERWFLMDSLLNPPKEKEETKN